MGLYKRGKVWWLSTDPVTGKRVSTRCTDKTAAKLFEAERQRLAADPAYAASHEATIGKWADKVMALKQKTKADGTQHMYRVKLGHVVRVFGRDCPMVDVTPKNVDAYVEQRQSEKASNNTIGKELTALIQICKLARRAGEFVGDVAALKPVGFSIDYQPRERVLTRSELRTLLANLTPDRAAALALAVATGARHSELAKIDAPWVQERRVIILGTKTEGSKRSVPTEAAWQEPLMALAIDHLPVRWPRMSKDLTALAVSLGMEPVTANDLRRTFATWMIESGVDRESVARMLGHRGTQMVFKVYGRESAEAFGENVRRQLERGGTESAQSAPDGSECSGGPETGIACFLASVAPARLELARPEGPGILNPSWSCEPKPKQRVFQGLAAEVIRLDTAVSGLVGTRTSQFRALALGWFRRAS